MEAASGNALHFCEKNRLEIDYSTTVKHMVKPRFLTCGIVIMSVAIRVDSQKQRTQNSIQLFGTLSYFFCLVCCVMYLSFIEGAFCIMPPLLPNSKN